MSGGERARALFVLLSLRAPNFLILDEPTNHIDIDGKEQLEAQLLESGAAVLITSHDRRFLDTVAQRYVLIRGKRLIEMTDPAAFYESPDDTAVSRQPLQRASAQRRYANGRHARANRRDRGVARRGSGAQAEVPEAGIAAAVARGAEAAVRRTGLATDRSAALADECVPVRSAVAAGRPRARQSRIQGVEPVGERQ